MNRQKVVVVKEAKGRPPAPKRPSARRAVGEVRVVRITASGAPVIIYR